jgi:hypothetical protein
MPDMSDARRQWAEEIIDKMVDRGELIRVGADRIVEAELFFNRGWKPASCALATKRGRRRKRPASG